MRTIHLLRKLNPAEWGGTEMAIQRLFDGLRQRGVKSVVYCPRLVNGDSAAHDPLVSNGYQVRRFNAFVPIWGISPQRRRQMVAVGGNLMSFDLVSALWREKDASIIHSHALGRIGGIAQTIARRRHIPFVLSIHGGVFDLPENLKKAFNAPLEAGWEWGRLFGLLFRSHRLFQNADAILTCNSNEAELLRDKFPDKRIVVQPHGLDPAPYQKDHRAAARAAFPRICGRTLLLCLGRVDPIKNQGWLIQQMPEICKRYPDSLLVLAGPCTDEPYGEMIQQTLTRHGLEDRVLMTGGLPPGDPRLIGLLQQARAVVVPSVSETFGLVILEAWAAGAMVLSSRTSGSSALVDSGTNGWLFDLANHQSFHDALDRILSNPDQVAEMVRHGQEKLRDRYSLGAVSGKLWSLYQELIEEKQCTT